MVINMSKQSGIKINEREAKMLYVLGGLLVLVAAIMLVFQPYMEKNAALNEEGDLLQSELTKLKEMQENESAYITRVEEMQDEIEEIFDLLPSNITAEDEIIYAKNIEENYDMEIHTVTFTEPAISYTMNENETNPKDAGKLLCFAGVTMECKTSYASIKDCLRDIANDKKRRSVDNITLQYDEESGKLTGSVTVNTYCLLGSDREYIPEAIDSVTTGTTNIFGKAAQ